MDYFLQALKLHKKLKGKIGVCSKVPVRNKQDLSLAYTPGVAEVCRAIAKQREKVFDYTMKANAVAVVTDGSAVLGLGNIGPEAALPGTAIVVLAALMNALAVVKKKADRARVVINGAGAAAIATANLLVQYGFLGKNTIMVDSRGIIYSGRGDLNPYKQKIAKATNPEKRSGGLEEAIAGADVFIGVSVADALKPAWVQTMANAPIVFAMANPNPEISFADAQKTKIKVFGTGRSDYPNQINNVLAFPGIFRGTLDARARAITEDMKLHAAMAIARLISKKELSPTRIIPSPFDTRVAKAVAAAVRISAS